MTSNIVLLAVGKDEPSGVHLTAMASCHTLGACGLLGFGAPHATSLGTNSLAARCKNCTSHHRPRPRGANQRHATMLSGCSSIPIFVVLIIFWAQYGNVSDVCAGNEDFEKISDLHTWSIILVIYNVVFGAMGLAQNVRRPAAAATGAPLLGTHP